MTDIDWSKAPEGATHHCGAYNEFSEVWIKDLDENSYKFRVVGNEYDDGEWEFAEPIIRNELKLLTPRPQPKPDTEIPCSISVGVGMSDGFVFNHDCLEYEGTHIVRVKPDDKDELTESILKPVYTQEMHDNGEEVPKGAMVDLIFNGNGTDHHVEIVVITDQYIITKIGTLEQHYHKSSYSIKPIDQRTDEEKAIDDLKVLLSDEHVSPSKIFNAIKSGKVHEVTFNHKA